MAIVAGQTLARSRAGAILAIAALPALSLMISHTRPISKQIRAASTQNQSTTVVFGGAVFAAIFALQVGLGRIIERFEN